MKATAIFRHPGAIASIAARFPEWYFLEVPVKIVKGYRDYALALWEIFSFLFLLKTLLKPWKSITEGYRRGMSIGERAQAFTLNCTSRVIGLVFRICAFIVGVCMEVIVLVCFLALFLFWCLYPFLLMLYIYYLSGGFS